MSTKLRGYLLVTAAHGFLQGLLLFAISINSQTYGFEWYLARLAQLVFAVAYTMEVFERYEMKNSLFIASIIGLAFGVTPTPEIWYNWLAFGYSLALFILGTSIVEARDWIARTIGLYWSAMGCWQYAFARLSMDASSLVWKLNWWLPSLLSVSTFLFLAVRFNVKKESAWRRFSV